MQLGQVHFLHVLDTFQILAAQRKRARLVSAQAGIHEQHGHGVPPFPIERRHCTASRHSPRATFSHESTSAASDTLIRMPQETFAGHPRKNNRQIWQVFGGFRHQGTQQGIRIMACTTFSQVGNIPGGRPRSYLNLRGAKYVEQRRKLARLAPCDSRALQAKSNQPSGSAPAS